MEAADYYHFARAMESVNPVAEILYDAVPLDGVKSQDGKTSATALKKDNDFVFLVSDYSDKPAARKISISLPAEINGKAWRLADRTVAGTAQGRELQIEWQPGAEGYHTALFYVGPRNLKK